MRPSRPEQNESPGAKPDRALLAILALSFAVKLALALIVDGVEPIFDERVYVALAERLATEGVFATEFRPPLYPGLLALIITLGGRLLALRILQVVLSTITVALIYWIVRGRFGAMTARVAAALIAFDPVLVAFTHLLWSETLFVFLFWGMAAALLGPFRTSSAWRWLAAGVFLGAAGLTRPVVLGLGPVMAAISLWRAWSRAGRQEEEPAAGTGLAGAPGSLRSQVIGFSLLGAGALAIVLPWTVRNYLHTGDFVLVDTNAPFNFLVGVDPGAVYRDKDDYWDSGWGEVDGVRYQTLAAKEHGHAQRRAMQIALERIAADPSRFLSKSLWEAGHLLTLDSFALRHLRNGWYGGRTPGSVLPIAVALSIPWSLLLIATGAIGYLAMDRTSLRAFGGMTLLYFVVIFALTYSLSRYQVPLRPVLAVGVAWFLVHAREARGRLFDAGRLTRRGIASALILLFLVAAWARDVPLVFDMMVNGGRDHRMTNIRR